MEVRSTVSGAPRPAPVRRVLGRAERAVGERAGEVSVLFCGDRRMAALNGRWRRKDRPTDVLAFPAAGPAARDGRRRPSAPGPNRFLGDIVISVPYARRQARRRREPAAREVDRLLLHGYLHLLGYDHETDRGEMEALEANLRKKLKVQEKSVGNRKSEIDRSRSRSDSRFPVPDSRPRGAR